MNTPIWRSQRGFLLAVIGSAIGLGNLWRFPYIAYENGGGAFLLPYVLAMLAIGLPILVLEFAFGHRYRARAPQAFQQLKRQFGWLGWFQVCLAGVIALYYSVILAWVLSFFGYAFDQAWGIDTNFFFFRDYLHLYPKTELQHWYAPQWHIVVSLLGVWGICFAILALGLNKGLEQISRYATPIFMGLILVLTVRVCFLSGAWSGIAHFFTPDFHSLTSPKVWSAAFGQVFFSLGVGLSVMIAYASFLPQKTNLNGSALTVVVANGVFSLICAVLVFGMLGVLAHTNSQPFENVVTAGIGLAFVAIPAAINLLPMPTVVGPLFFFGLFLIGLTSQLSLLQAVVAPLQDRRENTSPLKISGGICAVGSVLAIFLTGSNGILLIDILDFFANQLALVFSGLMELLVIAWLYPIKDLRAYSDAHSHWRLPSGIDPCLKVLCPIILVLLLFGHAMETLLKGYAHYSLWDNLLFGGGCLLLLFVSAIWLGRKSQ